jgi:hypothetical protein
MKIQSKIKISLTTTPLSLYLSFFRFISLSLSFSFFRFIRDDKFAYDGRTKFWTKQDFFDFASKQPKKL